MKERILPLDSVQTSCRSRNGSFRLIMWMIFLVSVTTFAEGWAQTIPRPTDTSFLKACCQHHTSKGAAVPETYRAPDVNITGDLSPATWLAAEPMVMLCRLHSIAHWSTNPTDF